MHHTLHTSPRPTVSIILAVRNAARDLPATLRSVQAQTLLDWEVIVIDDGSTDASAEIVRAVAKRDARVRLLHSFGRGVSAARNLGISVARARLLAFLEAGDQWSADKLSQHVAILTQRPDVGVSFDQACVIDAWGNTVPSVTVTPSQDVSPQELLCEAPMNSVSTLVMRRSVLDAVGDFDEQMRFGEELELMLRVRCLSAWRIAPLGQVLTQHPLNPTWGRADLEAMFRGWQTLMAKVRVYAPDLVAAHYEHAQALQLQRLAQRAARLKLPLSQGLNLMSRALRSHPGTWLRQPGRLWATLTALARAAWSRQRYVFMPQAPF